MSVMRSCGHGAVDGTLCKICSDTSGNLLKIFLLESDNSRLRKAIEKHKKHATELAPKDAKGNPVFAHIDGELYNALEEGE